MVVLLWSSVFPFLRAALVLYLPVNTRLASLQFTHSGFWFFYNLEEERHTNPSQLFLLVVFATVSSENMKFPYKRHYKLSGVLPCLKQAKYLTREKHSGVCTFYLMT